MEARGQLHDSASLPVEKAPVEPHSSSCNKTNEMHQFLKFIVRIELYMFGIAFLSIIRSLVLYTQQ